MAHSRGKVALIAGVTGQDGAYLTELLLSKGYLVHGVKRRSSSFNTARIDHLIHDPHEPGTSFFLHYGDLTDATNIIRIVQETQPDEIYNLAAQSHVQVSFKPRNIPRMPTGWAPCAYWKHCGSSAASTRLASIRPRPRRCSAKCGKFRRTKTPRSIRVLPMRRLRFMPTGLP